jgi:putative (di)nucleoside polyphosphate hydrolase
MKFRENVAVLMMDGKDRLLVCERWAIAGAWQFPQGGVDEGESTLEALVREVEEEIGLGPDDYEILASKGGYRYFYPPEIKQKKLARHGHDGQEQTYFLCRIKSGTEENIDVVQEPREFRRCRWIEPGQFRMEWLPEFKRPVYREVMKDFFGVDLPVQ